ncbi:hypothetical protein FHX44_112540 [Pseudonocardia hierapolitana]|uniref:Peptidase M1 membrane alanine aminopeptidase domain-containing protein n=1 Tax=Pseudonocardia hierapolitana TaxID=1128676 RepID=A0A561SP69_9PSEU|nr:M1 family metallopeptidase [Pseudonocardia hierapolitana]TWF76645.1 hypothetical protein FHX44_112540 [Pseudonocardia hierapolitana]
MSAPNYELAPPPTPVDGLLAVPIHIQDVQATVSFDGAASIGRADVTLTYEIGPTTGSPLLDLRQTIGQVWVDGTPTDPSDLAARNVGAGSFSTVRVLDAVQDAGSVHTLRVAYQLGPPDSELGGSYPPVLAWSPGPRLRWTFGMSDLNAGRYLEAWLPSNLIWDRFPIRLDVEVTGTLAAHSIITNGMVTALGANHWSVQFPDHFAPLSHLLEIRASNTVESVTGSVTLPLTGQVAIEAWKLTGDPENLAARIADAAGFLIANETDYGPYLDDRFVFFFHGAGGGMEYAGATTTSVPALGHETFHSWFARGVTPASQADAWWDEAFTTFHDAGADDTEPFDFLDAPVELCSRLPFQRRTPGNAYADGSRFFRGVAATVGVATLRAVMRSVYERHRGGPLSTAALEEDLVARTGAASLVDAFHRFVYGFADPSPVPRLWLRDAPGHTGADVWGGEFWNSPDLWIRHADDGGTAHQSPESGQDNWFHARVRNDAAGAACRHFVVTFAVKQFAGTQFAYPGDFLPAIAASAAFDLAPGEERVVAARWPWEHVPPSGTHLCLLAAAIARSDHPAVGTHVWEQANLAQKNLTVVDLAPGEFLIVPVMIGNLRGNAQPALEVLQTEDAPLADVALVHRVRGFFVRPEGLRPLAVPAVRPRERRLMDCGGAEPIAEEYVGGVLRSTQPQRVARRFPGAVELPLKAKPRIRVPVALPADAPTTVGLKITAPSDAHPGASFMVHLVQHDGTRLVGGVAVEVHTPGAHREAT